MLALLAVAGAFEPGLVTPAPFGSHVQARGQLVGSRTPIGYGTVDAGTSLFVGPAERHSVGVTAQVTGRSIFGDTQFSDVHGLGAGVWVGLYASSRSMHQLGWIAAGPPDGRSATFGLLMQEGAFYTGAAYRWQRVTEDVEVGLSVDVGISLASVLNGTFATTFTKPLLGEKLGVSVGAMIGLSDFAWISMGVRTRPVESVEIGLTALTALPLFYPDMDPVHVSPQLLVRWDLPIRSQVPAPPEDVIRP
ncbi:MAG: hypothetical protein H6734_18815 [Alphaproteobacteria bacterium]|nr:hypothetical protein [Alphaproteobacteria bacterium]